MFICHVFALCVCVCVAEFFFICSSLYYKKIVLSFILSVWAGSCEYFAAMFMFGIRMFADFDIGFFVEQFCCICVTL
jgi:hypothetical protein